MKMTLLEVVQSLLSSMTSDNVNSIDDTVEATQVAEIVKQTYLEIVSDRNWPHLRKTFTLETLADTAKPTYLRLPDTVDYMETFKYDCRVETTDPKAYREIKYIEPDAFLHMCLARDSTATEVEEIEDFGEGIFFIYNDRAPTYYTAFDDEYIVCDSYNSDLESTLQETKTNCYGQCSPSWTMDDTFQIDLPSKNFQYLLAESKSICWVEILEQSNQKAEQQSRRQRIYASHNKWRQAGGLHAPNYGRS